LKSREVNEQLIHANLGLSHLRGDQEGEEAGGGPDDSGLLGVRIKGLDLILELLDISISLQGLLDGFLADLHILVHLGAQHIRDVQNGV